MRSCRDLSVTRSSNTGWQLFRYRVALTDLDGPADGGVDVRYEEPVFRPPCESGSLIIQATIGCPHNKCTFCGMYKGKKYRVRPLSEIKEDLGMARKIWSDPPSVFLADGNTIAMRTDDLVQVLDYVNEAFPLVERISCYGGARFIRGRNVSDLARLEGTRAQDNIHGPRERGRPDTRRCEQGRHSERTTYAPAENVREGRDRAVDIRTRGARRRRTLAGARAQLGGGPQRDEARLHEGYARWSSCPAFPCTKT